MSKHKEKIVLGKPVSDTTLLEDLGFVPEFYLAMEKQFIKYEISLDPSLREEAYSSLRNNIGDNFQVYSEFRDVHRIIYWTHEGIDYSQIVTIIPGNHRLLRVSDSLELISLN